MEGQEKTTKIQWENLAADAKERYEKGLKDYPYLQEGNYTHKRMQLSLMAAQGRSDSFIQAFFAEDILISSVDLDFLRTVAAFAGERFAMDTFYKKNVSESMARNLFIEHLLQERYPQLTDVERLLEETRRMRERFDLQMDFLKREQEQAKSYYEAMLEKEREVASAKAEAARARAEKELESAKERCRQLEEKADRETKERIKAEDAFKELKSRQGQEPGAEEIQKMLQEKCNILKQASVEDGMDAMAGKGYFQGMIAWREAARRRREKEMVHQYILDVICDPAYGREQLEVILQAARDGVPLENLRQMCNPKLKAENMKILALFFREGKEDGRKTGAENRKPG